MTKQRVPAPLADLTHHLTALLKALPQLPALWYRTQQHAPGIRAVAYDTEGGTTTSTSSPTERQAFTKQRDDHHALVQAIDRTCTAITEITNILGRNPHQTPEHVAANFCDHCDGPLGPTRRCTTCGKHETTKLCANPHCADVLPTGHKLDRCKLCYPTWKTSRRDRIPTDALNLTHTVRTET